ncbi:PhnB protein [Dysgonomonas alginatilytica]|uniref:PhnB protein n=2 Tax=Dysgonomonas alginatilytica TaxID=1605892 RepID=A0A2V3PK07_9BACT|nr:PhnB protein [Dysgonomonas alginatilytica]
MLAVPNITFNGQAEEAINFYKEVFNGEMKNLMRYQDEPTEQPIPDNYKKRIAIAWLYLSNGKNILNVCDAAPGEPLVIGNNIKMDMFFDDKEIYSIFDALSKDGKVITPLAETYFSPNFGLVIDKFGINWYLMQMPQ